MFKQYFRLFLTRSACNVNKDEEKLVEEIKENTRRINKRSKTKRNKGDSMKFDKWMTPSFGRGV